MKKLVTSIAATMLLTSSVFALELDTESIYAGGALALESIDPADSGIALVLMGGVPFKQDDAFGAGTYAIETELTFSLTDSSYDLGPYSINYSLSTLGVYSAYIYDINEEFFIKPRVGLIYKSLDVEYEGTSIFGNSSGSASEIGLALGIQGGYKINDQLEATIGLNLVENTDITHLSVGVQYHF